MEFLYIRHGVTAWNAQKKLQGWADIELMEDGVLQAKINSELLKNEHIDVIISSPLKRARQTAEIIRGDRDIPIVVDHDVIERNYGVFEGVDISSISNISDYWDEKLDLAVEKGECLSNLLKRIKRFLEKLKVQYAGKVVLVVAHGGLYRGFRKILSNKDSYYPESIKNCEVVRFKLD